VTRAVFALWAALAVVACGPSRPVVVPPTRAPLAPSAADILRTDLAAVFNDPQFERALWSVLVRPVDSQEDLFALNARKLVMPGSAMKLLTATAAGERLGWAYRFETRFATAAPIESGVLRGDLIVIGGGDPAISERSDQPEVMQALARQVRSAGVTKIEGGIIGHDDLFDDRGLGDGWTLDNLPYGYSAPVSALMYNEGSVDLVVRAGAAAGDPVAIQIRPEGSGLQIDNGLVTVTEAGAGALTLQRLPGASRVSVLGQVPAKALPFVRTASVDNPTRFFAEAFRRALLAEGIQIGGDAVDSDDFVVKPDVTAARTLVTRQSPPLSELSASMMRVSQNQYAEILFKAIGGRRGMQEILGGWGIPEDGYIAADGSGLSRYNFVTADTLVRILQRAYSVPMHASVFAAMLPVAGRDGTLSRRLVGTAAEGKVRAKTGTVDNVRAIAGYISTAGGQTFAFSIIANNFSGPSGPIDAAADRALVRLATFSPQP